MVKYRDKKGRKSKRPDKTTFEYWYYDLKLSAEEIATKCDVKPDTIYNWAHQFRVLDQKATPS